MKGVEKEFSVEEFAALKDFCKTIVEKDKKEHEKKILKLQMFKKIH